MQTGLQDSPLSDKIWRVSQIINRSPFSDEVLGLHEARLDWILERYAADNPDKLKFERASTREARTKFMTTNVRWADVLSGHALAKFFGKFAITIPDAWKTPGGPRPGMMLPPAPTMSGPGAKAFAHDKPQRV